MTKLTIELKEKWVAALRSGDYPQARGGLRRYRTNYDADENHRVRGELIGYCCLGVLCEIAGLPKYEPGDTSFGGYIFDEELGVKSDTALPSSDEYFLDGPTEGHLIGLNDSEKKDFKEIADWIEAYIVPDLNGGVAGAVLSDPSQEYIEQQEQRPDSLA